MFKLGRISGNEPHSQQRPGKRPRAAMAASVPENTDAARPCPGPKAVAPPPPAEASAHAAAAGADARGRQLLIVTEQVRVTSDCTCHARHDLALARHWHQPLAQHARADGWHTVGTALLLTLRIPDQHRDAYSSPHPAASARGCSRVRTRCGAVLGCRDGAAKPLWPFSVRFRTEADRSQR